ncbi:MAG: hypothetical protein WBD31_21370, partial [Rubripirellula sp.]
MSNNLMWNKKMRNNILLTVSFPCLAIVLVAAAAASAETILEKKSFVLPRSTKTHLLTLGPESLDPTGSYRLIVPLSDLVPGKKSFALIKLRNDSNDVVEIGDVGLSCNCTEFGFRLENGDKIPTIPIGGEIEAVVGVNVPQTQTSKFQQSARLSISNSESKFISLSFRGEITVPFEVREIGQKQRKENGGWENLAQIIPSKNFGGLEFDVDCGERELNPRIVETSKGR